MSLRGFALATGLAFTIVGAVGLFGIGVEPSHAGDPHLWVSTGQGRLFGLFAVNVLHHVIHLLAGLAGLAAAAGMYRERLFARGLTLS